MKNFSLAIAMLFCFVAFGQEKTKKDSVIKSTEISKDIILVGKLPIENKNQPLYVVDGKPMNFEEFKTINPETIESITILKDSATISLRHRCINGVVIIKTKKLSKKEFRKMKKNKDS